MPLGKLWGGRFYGTNTGNLFIEFDDTGPQISGTLRVADPLFGLSIYTLQGSYGEILSVTGKPVSSKEGVETGELTIQGRLTPEGVLRGQWHSSIGTAGTFEAYPHDINSQENTRTEPRSPLPEQVYIRTVPVGSVTLYTEDVTRLLKNLSDDFVAARPIVTFNLRGSEVSKYADDFAKDIPALDQLRYLKITAQEPEAHGINRLASIELRADGPNEVRVQGIREPWVIGKAAVLSGFLKQHEKILLTTLKKYGLNLNAVIFLLMLVFIPSITSEWQRLLFVASVVSLLSTIVWLHRRLIPNALIYLGDAKPNAFSRVWPTILSFLVTAAGSLAAALLFRWLTQS